MFILPIVYNSYLKKEPTSMNEEQFAKWLSGFIDAEGNFQVFFDRGYLRVLFRINLHIDDVKVLYAIQKYLGIGNVRTQSTSAVYSIGKLQDLITVLLPLLEMHSLRTTKYLDYIDFKKILHLLSSPPASINKIEWDFSYYR